VCFDVCAEGFRWVVVCFEVCTGGLGREECLVEVDNDLWMEECFGGVVVCFRTCFEGDDLFGVVWWLIDVVCFFVVVGRFLPVLLCLLVAFCGLRRIVCFIVAVLHAGASSCTEEVVCFEKVRRSVVVCNFLLIGDFTFVCAMVVGVEGGSSKLPKCT